MKKNSPSRNRNSKINRLTLLSAPRSVCASLSKFLVIGLLGAGGVWGQVFDLEFGTPQQGTNATAIFGLGPASTATTLTFLNVAPSSGASVDMRVTVINQTPSYAYSMSIPDYKSSTVPEPNNDLGYIYNYLTGNAVPVTGGISYRLEFFEGGGTFSTPFVLPAARFLMYDVDGEATGGDVQTESVRAFTSEGFTGYQVRWTREFGQ